MQNSRNEMAMLRFSLIAPCINNTYTEASKSAYYRAVSQKPVTLPDGSQIYFNANTLGTWESRYRRLGFEGLQQRNRADRGYSRKLSGEHIEAIAAIKKKYPKINATQIHEKMILENIISASDVSVSTIQRHIKKTYAKDAQNPDIRDRKAFEERFSNGMWQADTLYGPHVLVPKTKTKTRAYLQMIIDDKSRMIVAGKFYDADNSINFLRTLKSAIATYGIPQKLYVDNGSAYKNGALSGICGHLGCVLLHTPVRDGASKGKCERNFRTLRDRWLNCIDLTQTIDMDSLNASLGDYIIKHNATIHSAHGTKPIDVFAHDAKEAPVRMPISPEWLRQAFRIHEYRRVKKDGTITIARTLFDAPPHTIGSRIEVCYTPGDISDVWAVEEDGTLIPIRPTDKVENSKTKRNNSYSLDYSKGA